MCGRYTLTTSGEALAKVFELLQAPEAKPRYNIAPTQLSLVVRAGRGGVRTAAPLRWGLVPHWAKDLSIGARMINARAENLDKRPAFREALGRRRCLVPADGFYEWKAVATGKQPYRLSRPDGAVFAMAGLWETWTASQGTVIETFTVITVPPNAVVAAIHDRMPAILPREAWALWLDPRSRDTAALLALLTTPPADLLRIAPVSRRVNTAANDDPDLIREVPADPDDDGGGAGGGGQISLF